MEGNIFFSCPYLCMSARARYNPGPCFPVAQDFKRLGLTAGIAPQSMYGECGHSPVLSPHQPTELHRHWSRSREYVASCVVSCCLSIPRSLEPEYRHWYNLIFLSKKPLKTRSHKLASELACIHFTWV